ncbi:Uncharacterized protein OBRU01_00385, partial [Operophtera brumata]
YDIIIIPILKTRLPVNYNKHHPYPIQKIRSLEKSKHQNNLRIDIENYEDPTTVPDLDNIDYMKERYGTKRTEEDMYDMEENYGDNKIVGGREVEINLYPYHVAYGTNCGAAIIDKKWIITAGHCGKKPYIKVGSKYLNQGKKINIKESIVHPNWSAKNKDHPFDFDFQLLETEEDLNFDENIQSIKIARIEDMVIDKVITVTGWGNTKENGPYSSVLRAVRVPIISKDKCQNVPFPYFRGSLTDRMFCAGFNEGMKDAC